LALTIADGGPSGASGDLYLRSMDDSGESYIVPPNFTKGDYSGFGTGSAICGRVDLYRQPGLPARLLRLKAAPRSEF